MLDVNTAIRYEDILDTASEIFDSDEIVKDGLELVYYVEPERHRNLDEHLFYMVNGADTDEEFEHRDMIRVTVGGIKFLFIRSDKEITLNDREENE